MQHDQINEDGGRKHSLPAIQTYANVNPHTRTHTFPTYTVFGNKVSDHSAFQWKRQHGILAMSNVYQMHAEI